MEMIEKEGKGVVVYLNQEGRGIGLMEKMKAYKLQEDGMDTVDANICLGHLADERDQMCIRDRYKYKFECSMVKNDVDTLYYDNRCV